jgi:mRNA-degrading endonuclease RelE of RelBE toxin-antitoxin system
VSLTVVFRETALRNLARIRSEDKDLFARTRRAIAYRLHANDIRILYEVDDEAATVYIINIGVIS